MFYMDLIHELPQSSYGCCRLLILGTVGVCIQTTIWLAAGYLSSVHRKRASTKMYSCRLLVIYAIDVLAL